MRIEANGLFCFEWVATKETADELQRAYCEAVRPTGYSPESYAKRAAGYLMAYCMPEAGDPDRRPSRLHETWQEDEAAIFHSAVLWRARRRRKICPMIQSMCREFP